MPVGVYRYEGSIFEWRTAGMQGAQDDIANGGREDILSADLNDARLAACGSLEAHRNPGRE